MKLKSSVQIALIIVAGIILLTLISIFTIKSFISSPKDSLDVNGQSTIKVTPDLITIYYNIETTGNTTKEASDKNAEITDKLRTETLKSGFKEEDLKTENFNIYPWQEWKNDAYVDKGWKATNSLKIELSADQTDKIADLVDAGANSGAGIGSINFELTEESQQKYKAEAIKMASQDARIKAEAIAEGFNKKVGRLISVSLNDYGYYPWPIYRAETAGGEVNYAMAKESVVNIQPSDKEITAQVSATYKLR